MYIVLKAWPGRSHMELCELDGVSVLMHGDVATLFPSYDSARNAIRRSTRYAKRRNYSWDCHLLRIVRVQPA